MMPTFLQSANVSSEFAGVPGAHSGLMSGGHSRVDELNGRISSRLGLSGESSLQPNFDPRPVATKYSQFPVIERRTKPEVPLSAGQPYNPRTQFAPITANAPPGFYLANIDTETVLQNRHVAYQKGADQGVYVPDSKSDMFGFSAVGRVDAQTHPGLFAKRDLATSGSDIAHLVGRDMFRNNTRTQLRGL